VNERKLTSRETQLAKAIERLSARDMQRLLKALVEPYDQLKVMNRLLAYANQVQPSESGPESQRSGDGS
jgi:hypothetical protein